MPFGPGGLLCVPPPLTASAGGRCPCHLDPFWTFVRVRFRAASSGSVRLTRGNYAVVLILEPIVCPLELFAGGVDCAEEAAFDAASRFASNRRA